MNMLSTLLSGLESEETATVVLSRDKKGAAKVILTAKMDFDPDEKDEALRQLRAALARPLVIRLDKGEDPDEVLKEAIASFVAEQRSSRDTLKSYRADQVSNRSAAQQAQTSAENKAKEPEKPAAKDQASDDSGNNPAPAPEDAASNPDTLF
jgi:hypothetical protein